MLFFYFRDPMDALLLEQHLRSPLRLFPDSLLAHAHSPYHLAAQSTHQSITQQLAQHQQSLAQHQQQQSGAGSSQEDSILDKAARAHMIWAQNLAHQSLQNQTSDPESILEKARAHMLWQQQQRTSTNGPYGDFFYPRLQTLGALNSLAGFWTQNQYLQQGSAFAARSPGFGALSSTTGNRSPNREPGTPSSSGSPSPVASDLRSGNQGRFLGQRYSPYPNPSSPGGQNRQ